MISLGSSLSGFPCTQVNDCSCCKEMVLPFRSWTFFSSCNSSTFVCTPAESIDEENIQWYSVHFSFNSMEEQKRERKQSEWSVLQLFEQTFNLPNSICDAWSISIDTVVGYCDSWISFDSRNCRYSFHIRDTIRARAESRQLTPVILFK